MTRKAEKYGGQVPVAEKVTDQQGRDAGLIRVGTLSENQG